jgi:hypothetical protein
VTNNKRQQQDTTPTRSGGVTATATATAPASGRSQSVSLLFMSCDWPGPPLSGWGERGGAIAVLQSLEERLHRFTQGIPTGYATAVNKQKLPQKL